MPSVVQPSKSATVAVVLTQGQIEALHAIRDARFKQTGTLPSVSSLVREALVDFARFQGVSAGQES